MIIVKIIGGLGNQLFQYAAARCLAHRHNTKIALDLTYFEGAELKSHEIFWLDRFQIHYKVATLRDIKRLVSPKPSLWQRASQKLGLPHHPPKPRILYEPNNAFMPEVLTAPDALYLDGYFQSERYFSPIRHELRQELTFKTAFSPDIEAIAERIRQVQSVGLLVRRGDYFSPQYPHIGRLLGICDEKYYAEALRLMYDKIGRECEMFLFSQDMEWCRTHLALETPVHYIHQSTDPHHTLEVLYLMSQCRHFIMSNSSFCWWAVWLHRHFSPSERIIIAPEPWLRVGVPLRGKDSVDEQAIYAPEWLRVAVPL